MNKYERKPDYILDLHGYNTKEAAGMLDLIIESGKYAHMRIITGKGAFRETGPVMRSFVKSYFKKLDIRFETSKLYNGGEGALEVFFKKSV